MKEQDEFFLQNSVEMRIEEKGERKVKSIQESEFLWGEPLGVVFPAYLGSVDKRVECYKQMFFL